MPKVKEKSSEEWLRGQLRESNKKVRQLERRIKELEKYSRTPGQKIIVEIEEPEVKLCGHCGKGKIEVVNIVGRIFEVCQLCDERKKIN